MNKMIQRLLCTAASMALSLSVFAAPVAAADTSDVSEHEEVTTITFAQRGADKGIFFQKSESYGLFPEFGALIPNENRQQTIRMENKTETDAQVYLVMKAAEQDESMKEQLDLIKKLLYTNLLHLKISNGASVLYDDVFGGELGKEPTFENKLGTNTSRLIALGSLSAGNFADLKLELSVSPEMGNEYQNLIGKVDWLIEVRWEEAPPYIPPTSDSTPPVESIPDESIPDAGLSSSTESGDGTGEIIDEDDVPLTPFPDQEKLPQTGDRFPVILLTVGAIFCAGVVVFVLLDIKRKKNK